jgi:hypothetical protein
MNDRVAERTIADFGQQWTAYRDNSGYYGSLELCATCSARFLSPEDLAGRRVLEIGTHRAHRGHAAGGGRRARHGRRAVARVRRSS